MFLFLFYPIKFKKRAKNTTYYISIEYTYPLSSQVSIFLTMVYNIWTLQSHYPASLFHIFCIFAGMKRNILPLYLIKLSKWFTLVMPIIVLFYEKYGLGLQDVFILKSVYSIAAVTLEIPSGYLADVWGRRKCLILGCILFFFGYLCYSFTSTFTAFLFAEILLGTGQTLVNGADSALLYDTTAQYKKENLYLRYEGQITMIGNFAEALAGIFGGLLAAYSLRFPFYAQAVIAFIGIPAAFALKEINRSNKTQNPVNEIIRIIQYSLVTNKPLCYNIIPEFGINLE